MKWVSIRKISRPPCDWHGDKQPIYSGGVSGQGGGEIRAGRGNGAYSVRKEQARKGIYG